MNMKEVFGATALPVRPKATNPEDLSLYFAENENWGSNRGVQPMVLYQGTEPFDVEHGGFDGRYIPLNSVDGIGMEAMPDLQEYGDHISAISAQGGFLLYDPYNPKERTVVAADRVFYDEDGYLVAQVGKDTLPIRHEPVVYASHQRSPRYRTLLVSEAQYWAAYNKALKQKNEKQRLPYFSTQPEQSEYSTVASLMGHLYKSLTDWFEEVHEFDQSQVSGFIEATKDGWYFAFDLEKSDRDLQESLSDLFLQHKAAILDDQDKGVCTYRTFEKLSAPDVVQDAQISVISLLESYCATYGIDADDIDGEWSKQASIIAEMDVSSYELELQLILNKGGYGQIFIYLIK